MPPQVRRSPGGGRRLGARPGSRRRAYLVWLTALAAYVVAVTGRTSLGVAGPEALDRFSINASTLATFSLVQLGVYAGAQIPAGLVLDRIGSRRMIATGAVVLSAGQLLLALAETVPVALVARVLIGLGDAATLVSVLRLVPVWFRSRTVPLVTQLTGILGQLGQVVSAVPFLALVLAHGWTPAFATLAGTGLLVAVLVVVAVRDVPAAAPPTAPAVGRPSVRRDLGVVVREPGAWLGFFTHFVTLFPVQVLLLLWGVPFLTEGQGRSAADVSFLLTLTAVASIVIGIWMGDFVGRFPHRRTELVLGTVAASTLVWVTILVPGTPRPLWQLVALMLVAAAGMAGCAIGFDFARTSVPHAQLGTATGMVNVGGYSASVVAILLVGLALDLLSADGEYTLGDFRAAFAVSLTPLLLVGVSGVLLSRSRLRARERAGADLVPA